MKPLLTIREAERFQKRIAKGELILRSDLRDIELEAQYYEYLADKEASKPTPDGAYVEAWRSHRSPKHKLKGANNDYLTKEAC